MVRFEALAAHLRSEPVPRIENAWLATHVGLAAGRSTCARLEPDPAEPRRLLTEPGVGHRLALD